LKPFLIRKQGDEKGINVEGSVEETIGLRWPARDTSASAPVATTGNAVLPRRAIFAKHRGGGGRKLASQQSPRPVSARGKFCMKKRMEMRPLRKRESREKQKLEQEQQALLEQWGVTEQELKDWSGAK
jgi:hypothetical protein